MGKKKSAKLNLLYLIGMALVVIGFCCPMFKGKLFGSTSNGFSFIGNNNGTLLTVSGLLIFIGGCLGLLLEVLPMLGIKVGNAKLLKLIALIVTVAGGIILVITFSGNGSGNKVSKALNKAQGKGFLKHAYVGFYMILAGWIASIVGYFLDK